MPQTNLNYTAVNPAGKGAPIKVTAGGGTVVAGDTAVSSALNVTAATVLKVVSATAPIVNPGHLVKISVITAGSAGTVNDCATTGAVAAANQIGVIPATVGVYAFNFPYLVGLVIAPGSGQVVSVAYT